MKEIIPQFKDDTDKIIVVGVLVTSIFAGLIPALIAIIFFKEKMNEASYNIIKAFLNFEILLLLISLFFAIPIIGWLTAIIGAPIVALIHTIVIIIMLCAIAKEKPVKVPVPFEFI